MCQLVYTIIISNNHPLLYLWWKENLLKHFPEKNYKKQTQMFYQNHSLVLHHEAWLHAAEIFCNLILRNHWKISNCFTELGVSFWYMGFGIEKWLNYLTRLELTLWYMELDLKSTQTILLDLDWFYDILDLNLKNTWTNLLDSE